MESEGIDVGRPHRPRGTQKQRNQEFRIPRNQESSHRVLPVYTTLNPQQAVFSVKGCCLLRLVGSRRETLICFGFIYLAAMRLSWQHVGASSLIRNRTRAPCIGILES